MLNSKDLDRNAAAHTGYFISAPATKESDDPYGSCLTPIALFGTARTSVEAPIGGGFL
jgi:hypothetical protein